MTLDEISRDLTQASALMRAAAPSVAHAVQHIPPRCLSEPSRALGQELREELERLSWPAPIETYAALARTRIFSTAEIADAHAWLARNDPLKPRSA